MSGAERAFSLIDTTPDWSDPLGAKEPSLSGQLEFRSVSFAYTTGGPRVLNDISFAVQPGEVVAIVGATGSGKSTIINLIAKFYLPQEGVVLMDGQDLAGISSTALHRQMGIVLQQNFLFSDTVLENIRAGRPGATDEEVREAARRIGCLDALESLPQGLATKVNDGNGVSFGQRQLICFARAMLADPRIFILDEATSSVDPATEVRIQGALSTLLHNRTSIVVAHRLSTVRNANLVLVMQDGRIVERGTHDSLILAGGVYAGMYRRYLETASSRVTTPVTGRVPDEDLTPEPEPPPED